jgi:hypothetical protein
MKMPFALAVATCTLALALLAPAPARMVTISVIRNLTMTVGQTAEIRVDSYEAKAPNIIAVTCGSYPPGKPTDMVAITRTHRSVSSHVYGGGTLMLYVKAQHPGRCFIRYGALGVVEQATAQTDITVKP